MNDIFHDMVDECVVAYLDDILIYSEDQSKHKGHVCEVLKQLRKHGLYAALSRTKSGKSGGRRLEVVRTLEGTEGLGFRL